MGTETSGRRGPAAALLLALLAVPFTAGADGAAPLLARLLFGASPQPDRPRAGQLRSPNRPDRVTEGCLHCHDGLVTERLGNHPVGVRYGDAWRSEPDEYRALAGEELSARLVNGRVSCASCHGLKQTNRRLIESPMPNLRPPEVCTASNTLLTGYGGRDLCLSCHIK